MMRSLARLDDHECAARAQRGDGKAFSELVARYQDKVYRFLLRLTRSQGDAMDLTQDTFLRAFQGIDGWRPDALFWTWLFRIARNLAFDRLRRDRLVEFVELDDEAATPDAAAGPEEAFATAQRIRLLESALAQLSPEHREIILLREIEGMPYDELAAVLALHPGTVKSRLARARAALLDLLENRMERTP